MNGKKRGKQRGEGGGGNGEREKRREEDQSETVQSCIIKVTCTHNISRSDQKHRPWVDVYT